jgi:zinc/manganese transport system permease protein
MVAAWMLGAVGYAVGLGVSTALDLPSGPAIVWALAVLALIWYAIAARTFAVPE